MINTVFTQHEREKRRAYNQRIREVEHDSFTPLIFSASGGMGPSTTIAYRRLAALLAEMRGQRYSLVMTWLRCRLSFSLLRSAVTAIRGSRIVRLKRDSTQQIELVAAEGRIPSLEKTVTLLSLLRLKSNLNWIGWNFKSNLSFNFHL